MENGKIKPLKIFAFFGVDIDGYPDDFLESLDKDEYTLLALDSRAIELASLSKIPFTIINDWLNLTEMLDIQDNAWYCENNWYREFRDDFTSDGICWPEFDHTAMNHFWLDVISSLKLAEIFREYRIEQLLIIKQNEQMPVLFYWEGSVCKIIWENELADRIKIIESEQMMSATKVDKKSITSARFIPLLYSSQENLTGNIAFFVSETELGRSHDAILDLLNTFPKRIVIIPNNIPDNRICHYINKWSLPIILIPQNNSDEDDLSKKFSKGYENTINASKGKAWEKGIGILNFHFLYYCQHRWPMLNNLYKKYLITFSKNPPQIVIGSVVTITEWQLPILAAQQCGIKTVSIPHSIAVSAPTISIPQTIQELKFDHHLMRDNLSKEILVRICLISEKKFIGCINCTDTNSYIIRRIDTPFSQKCFKILVLFSPTSLYVYPHYKSRLIYPAFKNPKTQIQSIKMFNSPPEDLREKLSIKFKVHPGFSELQLFHAAGEECMEKLLPTDSELEPVLDETDIVIGVNYFGSALFLALKNKKPIICFNNDEFFEKSILINGPLFELFRPGVKIIHTPDELWDFVRKILTDPSLFVQMKSDVSESSEKFFESYDYPTIGKVIEELIQSSDNSWKAP